MKARGLYLATFALAGISLMGWLQIVILSYVSGPVTGQVLAVLFGFPLVLSFATFVVSTVLAIQTKGPIEIWIQGGGTGVFFSLLLAVVLWRFDLTQMLQMLMFNITPGYLLLTQLLVGTAYARRKRLNKPTE